MGRDRTKGERLSVPFIVRSLTHDTAHAVGLDDCGLLKPGYKADINLIDFDALRLNVPTVAHDLPSGGVLGYFDDVEPDGAPPVPRSKIVDHWIGRQREIIAARGQLPG
jgi:cytosine/adenosine deaminase-related metal-dependent hydrolase